MKKKIFLSVAVLLLFWGLSLPAYSAPPVVKTVPWVATNPLVPHDTWSGKQISLKGTADVQGATILYSWDFGDGTPVANGTVTDRYAIGALHTYTGVDGDVFTARLTVQNTLTGETGNKEYYVAIRTKTLDVEVNVAIDEGLWYLHKNQYRYTSGVDMGDWRNLGDIYYSLAGAAVNAFEANGHVESLAGDSDPYKETVARGLKFIIGGLISQAIGIKGHGHPEDYDGVGGPDPGTNGLGIRVNQGSWDYQHGMVADAIIASGTPNAVTVNGPANIFGRTYKDIIQDMIDFASWGQYDNNLYGGGWTYGFGAWGDNSISQWVAIAMIPAERAGWAQVPQWVKDWNPNWLRYSQHAGGYFGYQSSGPIWGPYAVTPSGMVQMVFSGIGRGDLGTSAPSWDKAEKYIRNNFGNTGGAYYAIKDYYYGLFSFVKSMRLHQPPITMLRDYTTSPVGDLNWYNAQTTMGDPTDGVARTLTDDQDKSGTVNHGRWTGHNYYGLQYYFETPWAILMLGQTIFEAGGPVAVAEAIPNPGVAGQLITLDGSGSFHQDAGKSIDSWSWDLDNDGDCDDAFGALVTYSWLAVGDYPVKLCVSDNESGADEKFDDTIVTVRITTPPIAPTADAGGPYVFCPSQTWHLDGAGSNNPDEGQSEIGQPGDTIQEYAWELDGLNNDFDEASGSQPNVTAFFTAKGVGDYLISLRVTDTTATSYPSSSLGDLSDTDTAQVSVKGAGDPACVCISNLSARPKSGKVALVWTSTGADHYHVYRSSISGGPYLKIGETTSTYSTYIDYAVVNGTQYYYIVRTAGLNHDELCQSNEASATPRLR